MIDAVNKSMKKDFGCEPVIPNNSGVFGSSLVLLSNDLECLKIKGEFFSKGLVLFKKYAFSKLLDINKKNVKNCLVLNEKSSFLFTCNRTIFSRGIVKKKGIGPNYLVLNENGEVLGIALHEKSGLKNRLNIGYYLNQDRLKEPVF